MKRVILSILILALFVSMQKGCFRDAAPEGEVLYVSPVGSDENAGTKSKPLATLCGARDKIRSLKQSAGLPEGGVTVYIRGGIYNVTETTVLEKEDSGTEHATVRYAAYPGETPVFTGGSYIDGSDFRPLDDEAALTRIDPKAYGAVRCYDLYANGFTYDDLDYSKEFWRDGNLRENEVYAENDRFVPRMQIFMDDQALYLARYPNKAEGVFEENPYDQYLRIPEVLENGFDFETERLNDRKCIFRTYEDRIKAWQSLEDVVIFGMTGWEFFQTETVAEKIDPQAMTVTLKKTPASGILKGARYAFANILEELDAPGEYYIDKNTGMLYLYPVRDIKGTIIKISRFEGDYMIDVSNGSYITFSGLTFELTKKSVVRIVGGEGCAVEGCTFKNFGLNGVRLGGGGIATRDLAQVYGTAAFEQYINEWSAAGNGLNHRITGNDFLNTGHCAAVIYSGNTGRREHGGAVFEGNTVRHSGLIGSCYMSGLILNGCGITVKNNAFFFCRGQAINGNVVDTDIIYNEFCDSPCDMAEDTCAIYLNYMCLNDGVRIRYNYFHDITNRGHYNIGFDYARRAAAGYDNCQPFRDFSYNIVYNVPCIYSNPMSPLTPSTTVNNIFIDCNYVMDYPDEFIRDFYNGEPGAEFIRSYDTLPLYFTNGLYKSALWREKYPELYEFYEYMDNYKTDMRPVMAQVYDNLIIYLEKRMSGRSSELPDYVETDEKYGRVENNRFIYSDPGFADVGAKNFQLSREAAGKYGIEWLDMGKIGVQGLERPVRISDSYNDPLKDLCADKTICVEVPEGKPLSMLTLWRQVTPGVWEWAFEAAINGEYVAAFPVKPGGTYTVYYSGDAEHYPQYMGGLAGQAPPDGVKVFTVDAGHDMYDCFRFDLVIK